MLGHYQERLAGIRQKLATARHNTVLPTCNMTHCDLLTILLQRLNGDGSSSDHSLLNRIKAFVQSQEVRRRCVTEHQACMEAHDVLHKKSGCPLATFLSSSTSTIPMGTGAAPLSLLGSSWQAQGTAADASILSPELVVARTAYLKAVQFRDQAMQHLSDWQSLLQLLHEKKTQLLSCAEARAQAQVDANSTSSSSSSSNSCSSSSSTSASYQLDLTYCIRILDKITAEAQWYVNTCSAMNERSCEGCRGKKKTKNSVMMI